MSRRLLAAIAAAFAVLTAAGTTGCATSGGESASSSSAVSSTSTSGTSASAALCQAADDVRASLGRLQEVDVVQQGTDALAQAFTQAKSELATLADAAQAKHAAPAQQVRTDVDAVQAAVDQAKAGPTGQTIGAVATAARTLVQDTQALLASVGPSC